MTVRRVVAAVLARAAAVLLPKPTTTYTDEERALVRIRSQEKRDEHYRAPDDVQERVKSGYSLHRCQPIDKAELRWQPHAKVQEYIEMGLIPRTAPR